MNNAAKTVYQIEVALRFIAPPVWRRIQVTGDTKLNRLHRILQQVMGWTNSHLHAFVINGTTFGEPEVDDTGDLEMENERNIPLDKIFHEGDTFIYEYDFGDSWEHDLKIEKVFPPEPGVRYPRCLEGQRACPPEDCGGPPGYENLLDVLNDPDDEEYDEMREWVGGGF